jgi:hypothetical protein
MVPIACRSRSRTEHRIWALATGCRSNYRPSCGSGSFHGGFSTSADLSGPQPPSCAELMALTSADLSGPPVGRC